MTTNTYLAFPMADRWHGFWRGEMGEWILTKGLHIVLLLIGSLLVARFISWTAQRVTRRLDEGFHESDALVRSESVPSARMGSAGSTPRMASRSAGASAAGSPFVRRCSLACAA